MKQKKLKTKEYSYTVVYESLKEGGYQVVVPVLPGLVTYGRTFEEAREMAREAIQCCVESFLREKESVPQEASFLQERLLVRV